MNKSFNDSVLKVLKTIEEESDIKQRELSKRLDYSLGKINYLIKSLIEKGWVKVKRFNNSNQKMAYLYYLTPKGFEQKKKLMSNYLNQKMMEYEQLKIEIELLKKEVFVD